MTMLSKAQFITKLAPDVVRARREGSPLFPSVRLAQNLLETGGVIHSWFNLGGIKVGSGKPNEWWDGSSVNKGTWEVIGGQTVNTSANFRAYKSVYHFYRDQDRFFTVDRYTRVRSAKTPEAQAEALRLCGYATDPKYGAKIIALIDSYGLRKYDVEEKPKMNVKDAEKVIAHLSAAWAAASKADRPEIHRLANEVRKAAGIKET
ncbi:glycoside hydrolase family 73 protein [Cohnella mopanensis]|uniref:glycoside hydrolase family 73 protein n=1 Tax=Cohnella mopanensis TaxID=2911966 RepID=UPI001EF8FBD7|nr:glucosaminidase domain-containing protein [Cohnella mopanensis]